MENWPSASICRNLSARPWRISSGSRMGSSIMVVVIGMEAGFSLRLGLVEATGRRWPGCRTMSHPRLNEPPPCHNFDFRFAAFSSSCSSPA